VACREREASSPGGRLEQRAVTLQATGSHDRTLRVVGIVERAAAAAAVRKHEATRHAARRRLRLRLPVRLYHHDPDTP
jgi:hypothetical protein